MPTLLSRAIYWVPRILGLVFTAFLALFTTETFTHGPGGSRVIDLAGHLIPAAAMFVVVLIAWKHELVGAAVLVAVGAWYAVATRDHTSWVLVIAGPILALAALFAASFAARSLPPNAQGPTPKAQSPPRVPSAEGRAPVPSAESGTDPVNRASPGPYWKQEARCETTNSWRRCSF